MKMRELYPSKYLKADDVDEAGGEARALIKSVKLEEMQDNEGNKDEKPILYFTNLPKGMVMNKTNADRIAAVYGDESDDWRGKEIILYTEPVTAFGKTANAIRVKVPKPTQKPVQSQPVNAAVTPEPEVGEGTPF